MIRQVIAGMLWVAGKYDYSFEPWEMYKYFDDAEAVLLGIHWGFSDDVISYFVSPSVPNEEEEAVQAQSG